MSAQSSPALDVFAVANPRQSGYTIAPGAKRADVSQISDTALVTRGVQHRGKGANAVEIPVLIVKDGSSYRALELSACGAALRGEVISPAEYIGLLTDAQRASLKKLLA